MSVLDDPLINPFATSLFNPLQRLIGGIFPVYSFNALTATSIPAEIVCDRTTEASYRDNTGKYRKALANTARLHHAINGGRIGLINEATRTRRNHYPYPASGAVTSHFTANTGDITIVTNTDTPLTDDYTNHDQVWRISNTSGGSRTYPLAGTMGSVTQHNIRIWHKVISGTGSAIAQISGNHSPWTGELFLNSRVGVEQVSLNITPGATTDQLEIVVPDGMTIDITLAEAQNNNIIDVRYYAHMTTPVLHGIGAAATRDAEFIRFEGLDALGYTDNAGTAVQHGTFWGAEQTNACFSSLYDASSPATDYHYLRPSPNGDTLYFGEGGNVTFNSGTFPITGKRRPTPLDIATAFSWSTDTGTNFWANGTYNFTGASVNTPQNIDTLSLYRHDNAARDDSSCVLTKFELYDQVLDDELLRTKSYRQYGFVDTTVSQSNIDIKMRGFGAAATLADGDAGGPDYITTHFMNEYVPNYMLIRGPDYYDGVTDADYGGGALAKSSGGINGHFVNDDDPNNLTDGDDLTKVINTVRKNYGVSYVNNFQIDLGPFESARTVEEINGILKDCMQYLIDRLKQIGGGNSKINLQFWTKRFSTDDIIAWTWREMLREIVAENTNVIVIAEPYNFDLDVLSNAHYETEENYVDLYMQGQRRILKNLGIADFGNLDNPTISSATFTGTEVTLNFATENGANIVSGNTTILPQLFRVLVDGNEVTVQDASVVGQTTTLTVLEAIADTASVTVDYPFRLMDYNQGRVNYLLDPDNIVDNVNWADIRGTLTSNQIANPITGEITAELFTESTETGAHDIYQDLDLVMDATHTASIYVKPNGRTNFRLRLDDAVGAGDINVNFDAVAVTSSEQSTNAVSTLVNHSITDAGDGWFKLSMTVVINSGGGTNGVRFYLYSMDGSSRDYTGDGTSGFYVFRAEINNLADLIDDNDAGTGVLVDDSCYSNPVSQFSAYSASFLAYDWFNNVTSSPSSSYNTTSDNLTGVTGLTSNATFSEYYFVDNHNSNIGVLEVSTNGDISTATYNATKTGNVAPRLPEISDLYVSTDGLVVYISDFFTEEICKYSLSTAFDFSTISASPVAVLDTSSFVTDIRSFTFVENGSKLKIMGSNPSVMITLNLATAFDITSGTQDSSKTISFDTIDGNIRGFAYRREGLQLVAVGTENDFIYVFDLTTAYDDSTAILNTANSYDISTLSGFPTAILIDEVNENILVTDPTNNDIFSFNVVVVTPPAAGDTTVQTVLSTAEFEWDPTLASSYSGTGLVVDSAIAVPASGATQLDYRGSSPSGFEPAFVGTAGDSAAYFDMATNKRIELDINPSFISSLHESTVGDWGFIIAFRYSESSSFLIPLATGGTSTSNTGFELLLDKDTLDARVNISNDGGRTVNVFPAIGTFTDLSDVILGVSYNSTTNVLSMYSGTVPAGGTTSNVIVDNGGVANPNSNTLRTIRTGNSNGFGAGGRLYHVSFYDGQISSSDFSSLKTFLETRHGRTYS